MTLPRIGVTLGDPAGIGPEIVVKALSELQTLPSAQYVIYGESRIIHSAEQALGLRLGWNHEIEMRDLPPGVTYPKTRGPSEAGGRASFLWFEAAVDDARRGELQALVTAPISKESWSLAGLSWRGHTEYLERDHPEAIMSFWSRSLRVALLSHHLPLREALERVKKDVILAFLRSLRQSLDKMSSGITTFLVAGLNPHAGEKGILGHEEETEIRPAVEEAVKEGMDVAGPFPPDTVFLMSRGKPDRMVVALYHDQGLIAFKMEAFSTGVNMTLGTPFVRTSPDHGTAFEIAGMNCADPSSMQEALILAANLVTEK